MPRYVYEFVDTGETIELDMGMHDKPVGEFRHPAIQVVLPVRRVYRDTPSVTFSAYGLRNPESRRRWLASPSPKAKAVLADLQNRHLATHLSATELETLRDARRPRFVVHFFAAGLLWLPVAGFATWLITGIGFWGDEGENPFKQLSRLEAWVIFLWPLIWLALVAAQLEVRIMLLRRELSPAVVSRLRVEIEKHRARREQEAQTLAAEQRRKRILDEHRSASAALVGVPREGVRARTPTDHRDFEEVCAEWLRACGIADARATEGGRDGGVDVLASNLAAQCKMYRTSKVGSPEVDAFHGAASRLGKRDKLFFACGLGYTASALEHAKELGIRLWVFDQDRRTFRQVA